MIPTIVILFLLAATAHAEGPSLTEAKQLYLDAEFENAIARLEQVVTTLEARSKDDRRELADAYLYLGLSYSALGEDEKSRDAFRKLLALDRDRRLDTATFAPKVVALFDQAKASLPPPPGPTQRPPDPRFGLEWSFYAASLGEARLRPHDHLIFPGRNEVGSVLSPFPHTPVLPVKRWSAYAAIGRRERIEVDYAGASENNTRGYLTSPFVLDTDTTSTLDYRSDYYTHFQTLDVRLSKVWKSTGALVLRRSIGYRLLSAHQRIDETVDATLPTRRSFVSAESRVRSHGVRLGLDGDVRLSRRFNLDMRVGLTAYLAGRERGRDHGIYTDDAGSQFVETQPYTSGAVGPLWDGQVRLRLNLGQGLYLSQSVRAEGGVSVIGRGFGGSLSTRGGEFGLGWRFGSRKK
jgi:tetratricopeptide (TPR) repeat protein